MQRKLAGTGSVELEAPRHALWNALLDPSTLKDLMPGADSVERPEPGKFRATLSYGVGRFTSRYVVDLQVDREVPPSELALSGNSSGPLGRGTSNAVVTLAEGSRGGSVVSWNYEGTVSGPVALAGMTLLNAASSRFIGQFFQALSRKVSEMAA